MNAYSVVFVTLPGASGPRGFIMTSPDRICVGSRHSRLCFNLSLFVLIYVLFLFSVTVCLRLCVSVFSLSLSLSASVSVCLSIPISPSVSMSQSVRLSACFSGYICLSLSSLFLTISVSLLSLSRLISVCPPLPPSPHTHPSAPSPPLCLTTEGCRRSRTCCLS